MREKAISGMMAAARRRSSIEDRSLEEGMLIIMLCVLLINFYEWYSGIKKRKSGKE